MSAKKMVLIALNLLFLFACVGPVFALTEKVSEIKSHTKRYDGRRLSVSGYIAYAEYIPHENAAVLHLKLTDAGTRPEERDRLGRAEYLFIQDVGKNIKAIAKVYNEAQTARDAQDKITVKGIYDKKSASFDMDTFIYFIGKKKQYIYTDSGDRYSRSADRYYYERRGYYYYPHFHFGYYPGHYGYYPGYHGYHHGYHGYHHGYHGHHFGYYGY